MPKTIEDIIKEWAKYIGVDVLKPIDENPYKSDCLYEVWGYRWNWLRLPRWSIGGKLVFWWAFKTVRKTLLTGVYPSGISEAQAISDNKFALSFAVEERLSSKINGISENSKTCFVEYQLPKSKIEVYKELKGYTSPGLSDHNDYLYNIDLIVRYWEHKWNQQRRLASDKTPTETSIGDIKYSFNTHHCVVDDIKFQDNLNINYFDKFIDEMSRKTEEINDLNILKFFNNENKRVKTSNSQGDYMEICKDCSVLTEQSINAVAHCLFFESTDCMDPSLSPCKKLYNKDELCNNFQCSHDLLCARAYYLGHIDGVGEGSSVYEISEWRGGRDDV